MEWIVEFHPAFEREFDDYPETVQDGILARAGLIEIHGPQLGRPYADTLSGSRHANIKELRFDADNGVWRVAFAFDPLIRNARLFCLPLAINRAKEKAVSTGGLLLKPRPALMTI